MARMTRVSPPLLARELPGPQASTRVTRAPRRTRDRAVKPPNTPAPTTATRGRAAGRLVAAPAGRAGPARTGPARRRDAASAAQAAPPLRTPLRDTPRWCIASTSVNSGDPTSERPRTRPASVAGRSPRLEWRRIAGRRGGHEKAVDRRPVHLGFEG